MSYDIQLIILKPGESVRDVARRDQVEDEPYTAQARDRNTQVITAIQARYPDFQKFESDHHVELTDVAGGTGMQVSLYSSSGAITLPYWHDKDADAVFEKVNGVLRVVMVNSDFVAFDPQTEQELNGQTGLAAASSTAYSFGVAATQSITKKPWWRIW